MRREQLNDRFRPRGDRPATHVDHCDPSGDRLVKFQEHCRYEIGPATKVAGPYRWGLGGTSETADVSDGVHVTLDRKAADIDGAHDRGHVHRGLAGGVGGFGPGGGGNRRREQRDDPGGIHAGVTSADLVGLGHG